MDNQELVEYTDAQEALNDRAYNSEGITIHIDDATKGEKYFCRGCMEPMLVVRYVNPKHRNHFRHQALDVEIERKCTFSSETYRHKLAKEYLQEKRKVKVPNVVKYPMDESEGEPYLLEESHFVEAHEVLIEREFYEDDQGQIKWGRDVEKQGKNILIRPDVAFLNDSNEPILLIELVATHKVDSEKRVKLRRLGIDCIQIRLPSSSEEEIYEALRGTQKTKWIYNQKLENETYNPISRRNHKRLSSIDEIERDLLRETLECRAVKIKRLIRRIKGHLRTESIETVEQNLRSEIRRVENNTATEDRSTKQLQERLRTEVLARYSGEFIDSQQTIERVRKRHQRVEERYRELESQHFADERDYGADKERYLKLLERIELHQERIVSWKGDIDFENSGIESSIRTFREAKGADEGYLEEGRRELERLYRPIKESIERERGREEKLIEELRNDISVEQKQPERDRKQLTGEFENRYLTLSREIVKGECSELAWASDLSRDIRSYFEALQFTTVIVAKRRALERVRRARKCIQDGSHKDWT